MKRRRILLLAGTRPEIIKLAPLLWNSETSETWEPRMVLSGQHRDLGRQIAQDLDITIAEDLDLMTGKQTPGEFLGRAIPAIGKVIEKWRPEWIVTQGDTTTALAGALAASYGKLPLLHVEAGLRTGDYSQPFPEEMHRVLISRLACAHAAPTPRARDQLLLEGITPERILVSGNTCIDSLLRFAPSKEEDDKPKQVLVTIHRRENHGDILDGLLRAIMVLAKEHPQIRWVLPLHPNPEVGNKVRAVLGGQGNVSLLPAQNYRAFIELISQSCLVLTDSGGVQEEAPALGIPVLVLRNVTERPEAVDCGAARLVGTEPENIISAATHLLQFGKKYYNMALPRFPFGDGHASERILNWLSEVPCFPPEYKMVS